MLVGCHSPTLYACTRTEYPGVSVTVHRYSIMQRRKNPRKSRERSNSSNEPPNPASTEYRPTYGVHTFAAHTFIYVATVEPF